MSLSLHWAAGALLEAVVFVLAVYRKLFRQLPFFTIYLGLLLLNEVGLWVVYRFADFNSPLSFHSFWTMQALMVTARAIAVYEICRTLLSRYQGIWRFCRPFLLAVAAALITDAALAAWASAHHVAMMILAAERGLELAVLVILLFGLAFCRYYRIRTERHIEWIGLGLGFYSAVQVANNTVLQHWLVTYFPVWEGLNHASFHVATACWLIALLRPLPAPQPADARLNYGEYESLAPQITARLRELNTRLLEMWK